MDDTSVSLALIGIVGAVITTLFKQLNDTTKALNKNTQAHLLVAKAIKKGNDEAKQRNGHLGEQTEKIAKLIVESRDRIIDNSSHVNTMNVDKSIVKNQTVKDKK